jgi:hypothetical protein
VCTFIEIIPCQYNTTNDEKPIRIEDFDGTCDCDGTLNAENWRLRSESNGLRGRLRYYGRIEDKEKKMLKSLVVVVVVVHFHLRGEKRIDRWSHQGLKATHSVRRCTCDRRATPRARTDDDIGFRWDVGENTDEADWDSLLLFSKPCSCSCCCSLYISRKERERRTKKDPCDNILRFCCCWSNFLFVRPLFSHLFFPIRLSAGAPLN